MFDVQAIRAEFPILSGEVNGQPIAYLDNAASAQKPLAVMDAMRQQMETSFANVHRGLHTMANETTEGYEGARAKSLLIEAFLVGVFDDLDDEDMRESLSGKVRDWLEAKL